MKYAPIVHVELVREGRIQYSPDAIKTPNGATQVFRSLLGNRDREVFAMACMDTKMRITALNIISIGSLNTSLVHPREVFKAAILANADGIMLCHNHPSGNPKPSDEDKKMTNRLIDAGKLLGIKIYDHLILGEDTLFSFKQEGLME